MVSPWRESKENFRLFREMVLVSATGFRESWGYISLDCQESLLSHYRINLGHVTALHNSNVNRAMAWFSFKLGLSAAGLPLVGKSLYTSISCAAVNR